MALKARQRHGVLDVRVFAVYDGPSVGVTGILPRGGACGASACLPWPFMRIGDLQPDRSKPIAAQVQVIPSVF